MGLDFATSLFYIGVLVPITIIVPISLAVLKHTYFPPALKVLTYYLCLSGVTSVISEILAYNHYNNMPLQHFYTVAEFGVICLFYKKLFKDNQFTRYLPVIFSAFVIVCVINAVFFQSIFKFNSYTKPIEAFLVILLAIVYLMQLLEDFDKVISNNVELIYINSGFLLYFSGSFVLFTIFNIFVNNVVVAFAILDVHATLILLMYALFTIALWKLKK